MAHANTTISHVQQYRLHPSEVKPGDIYIRPIGLPTYPVLDAFYSEQLHIMRFKVIGTRVIQDRTGRSIIVFECDDCDCDNESVAYQALHDVDERTIVLQNTTSLLKASLPAFYLYNNDIVDIERIEFCNIAEIN